MDSKQVSKLPDDLAEKAEAFKRILESPAFNFAIEQYKKSIYDAWCNTSVGKDETARREDLWLCLQSALAVKGHLLRAYTSANNELHLRQQGYK